MFRSRWIDVDGPIHLADFGGTGPPMVLVHGLGGSHLNWTLSAPTLAERHAVVALDLAGFGRTPPAGRGVGMRDAARLLAGVLTKVASEPAVLVGNSMGGLLSMIVAGSHPDAVRALVLVDPALPLRTPRGMSRESLRIAAVGSPLIGPAMIRLLRRRTSPAGEVEDLLRMVCADPDAVPASYRAAAMAMSAERRTMAWSINSLGAAGRSLAIELITPGRVARHFAAVAAPTLLVHGKEDRLVHPASAAWAHGLRPDWELRVLAHVGHAPMIEAPARFISVVDRWLEESVGWLSP